MAKRTKKTIRPWPFHYLPEPLVPESVRIFVAKRIIDATSICMMLFGVFGFLALVTYDSGDAAFNVAGSADTMNWMGAWGAGFSDLMIQTVGYGAFGLVGVIGIVGYRLLRRKTFAFPLAIRVIFLFLGIFILATGFARLGAPEEWGINLYRGGVIGANILNNIASLIPMYGLISFLSFVMGGICCAMAVGYPRASWVKGWNRMISTFDFMIHKVRSTFGWVSHYDALDYSEKTKRIEKKTTPKAIPNISDAIDSVAERVRDVMDPVVVKPTQADKPKPQKQLNLNSRDGDEWELPPIDLLQEPPASNADERVDEQALQRNAVMLQQVLEDFSIQGEIVKIHPGPVVTLYELEPAPGTKSSRVIGLSDDIARSMSAVSVRAAVVPGRNVIGIEIPNKKRAVVYMRDILESKTYEDTSCKLPLILGKDIGGQPIIADLAKMPHLLVAGTTGSGKSVAVNTMLLSLLYKLPPEKCRFIMIDPKMLELSVYNDIPHLLSPVVTEPGKAVVALKWAVHEMEERYRAMSKVGVRNIDGYNARIREARDKGESLSRKVQTGFDADTGKPTYEEQPIELVELPYIVIIVDEFADLMLVAGKDVEGAIQRLAQMARAAGLHIIMATQRPSVDVITGVIKANFPTRISFQVTSKIDSRTILGEGGAEQLLGMGDMLYMAGGGQIKRVHGPFAEDEEVRDVVDHLKAQGEPDYLDTVQGGDVDGTSLFDGFGETGGGADVDELYDEAVAIVSRDGKASTSYIQRCLKIGYNRAASIIEEMERQGVVSPATATGKREVLVGEI